MFRWTFGADPAAAEYERLRRGMDELLTALSRGPAPSPMWRPARLFPLLNVRQVDNDFVVTAELPGMKIDDMDINIEGDTLSLKGERKPLDVEQGTGYHRRERATGTFQRSLTLPNPVDAEKVKAAYKDGILTVRLPIAEVARPRQIDVSTE